VLEHPHRVIDITLGSIDVEAKLLTLLKVVLLVNLEETNVILIVDTTERLTILIELAISTLTEGNAERETLIDTGLFGLAGDQVAQGLSGMLSAGLGLGGLNGSLKDHWGRLGQGNQLIIVDGYRAKGTNGNETGKADLQDIRHN
jgi:hypothetical protein